MKNKYEIIDLFYTTSPPLFGVIWLVQVGGQVEMNGMYGNAVSWSQLAQVGYAGANSIMVRDSVAEWRVGAKIAIASTDFDRKQAEVFTIKAVSGSQ